MVRCDVFCGAIVCCDAGVVPRKEFFETYAAAKYIHQCFPKGVYRVADLAAGHGLLSWMLLAMDDMDMEDDEDEDDDNDEEN